MDTAIYRRNAAPVESSLDPRTVAARLPLDTIPPTTHVPALNPPRLMPKTTPLFTATVLGACSALAFAQEASPLENPAATTPAAEVKKPTAAAAAEKPAPKPAVTTDGASAEEVAPQPTPQPKKPSFFERIFGTRKKKPTPTPAPEPTPSPTPRKTARKPSATPAPSVDQPEKPASTKPGKSTPAPKPAKTTSGQNLDMPVTATPTTTKKPTTSGPTTAPATPAPKPAKITPVTTTKPAKPLVEPPADADAEVKEKFRFDQARAKAGEDPQVKVLKQKADEASTDDESRKALRAYNKALFEKIRKIDSSVSDRATRLEAAILKRLSE